MTRAVLVLGPEVPKDAPKDFALRVLDCLRGLMPKTIFVSSPWMVRALEQVGGATLIAIEGLAPELREPGQVVAALNATSVVCVILPTNIHVEESGAHNHSIVRHAILAMALGRQVACDHPDLLSELVSRHLEEES